tara:strand:+ start:556 stop:1812 length:1257 start_codon:yes stop_codon:yes gene_type:complete
VIKTYELLLFKRFFLSKKNEGYISIISWFSLIGIALGVAVLIIVMSVMNGFRDELVNRIIGINGHINIFSSNEIITKDQISLFENNNQFSDIVFKSVIQTQGLIISNNKSRGVFIKGMKSKDLITNKKFNFKIIDGKIFDDKSNQVIIGKNLAQSLSVSLNDKIKIAIPKTDKTIFGNIPRFKTMIISGIFDLGMYEYDSNYIYIPINVSRSLIMLDNYQFNNLEIFVQNPDKMLNELKKLKNFINHNKLHNLYIISWEDRNQTFLNALKVERNVMFLILVLIILIATLNIVSGLIIFVKDKNKEIGILRAMGLSKISIIKIFLLIGSTIGVIGTFLGVTIGIVFSINIDNIQYFLETIIGISLFAPEIYFLSNLPSRIEYTEVIFITFISLLLTIISTIYPSIKSSRIDPIKVIRNE